MNATLVTTDKQRLSDADEYTDAFMTYRLPDGTFAFRGKNGFYRRVLVMIPGYDFIYGEATAAAQFDDAHEALSDEGQFPQGSQLVLRDRV